MGVKSVDRLALEFISALGMPPVEYVELAAQLGVAQVGMAPSPIAANPYGYPEWDLRRDPALLRATKASLAANEIKVSLGEGFLIMPGIAIADAQATMDVMAELGAPLVNTVVIEPDRQRAFDQFAEFAAMAKVRQMTAAFEFMPMMWPINLTEAAEFLEESGVSGAKLVVDAMHFYRSGSTLEDLARVNPERIGYVQICDVPMPAINPDYGAEARDNRLIPGEGDLPLAAFIAALPGTIDIGLEVPLSARAAGGIGPVELLSPAIAAARVLLT